jgi:N-acetylmuramoyl-L-alanine amidase
MVNIIDMLLTNHNRPKHKLIKLKGLVVHWTANTSVGSDADNNRNFFNTTKNSVSAHYVIDDKQIVRCLPDNEVGYHVGAKKYTKVGMTLTQGTIEKDNSPFYSPNYFTVGIEMCVNQDGDWNKTYQNTVKFSAKFLVENKLTIDNLYRHYDITGKLCPQMMIDEKEWKKFKDAVQLKINEMTKPASPKDELREALEFIDKNICDIDVDLWINNCKSGKVQFLDALMIKIGNGLKSKLNK